MTALDQPAAYELRIGGHLDPRWSAWFDGFTITHEDDGTTTLRGVVRDQSELHGCLGRIRDLGATLISVTSAAAPEGDASTSGIDRAPTLRQLSAPTGPSGP